MTLSEAFEKYPDTTVIGRKSQQDFSAKIEWWKGLKAWGNKESRALGFIIPNFMIDDANADDYEVRHE